jgi:hypothetical protein
MELGAKPASPLSVWISGVRIRFTATDLDGSLRTHFQTDEGHVAGLPLSTYRD